MRLPCLIGGLLVGILFCVGCEGEEMEPIVARLCYFVEVTDQPMRIDAFRTGRQLEPWLQNFAAAESLRSLQGGDDIVATRSWSKDGVTLTLGLAMGYRRAALALYRDDLVDPGIDERFTEFVYSEIGRDFSVFPCTDIEGAKLPVLYNWGLRQ